MWKYHQLLGAVLNMTPTCCRSPLHVPHQPFAHYERPRAEEPSEAQTSIWASLLKISKVKNARICEYSKYNSRPTTHTHTHTHEYQYK